MQIHKMNFQEQLYLNHFQKDLVQRISELLNSNFHLYLKKKIYVKKEFSSIYHSTQ